MSPCVYVPDDQALFKLLEITPAGRHVALVEAMNSLVTARTVQFPRQVMDCVVSTADPETDTSLCIWIKTVWKQMDHCRLAHGFLSEAQAWAQANGYPDGLDSALGGRESCVPGVVAYLMQLRQKGVGVVAVTDDHRPRPGRAALGEVCGKLEYPTMAPADFLTTIVTPVVS